MTARGRMTPLVAREVVAKHAESLAEQASKMAADKRREQDALDHYSAILNGDIDEALSGTRPLPPQT